MPLTGCAFNDTVQDTADQTTYSRRAYIAGQADAHRDIQHGVLAIEAHGLGAGYGKYAEILKQRYGIEERAVAGCGILDNKTDGHLRGYNEISQAEINRRFGPNVFDRSFAEARAFYEKKYPNERH